MASFHLISSQFDMTGDTAGPCGARESSGSERRRGQLARCKDRRQSPTLLQTETEGSSAPPVAHVSCPRTSGPGRQLQRTCELGSGEEEPESAEAWHTKAPGGREGEKEREPVKTKVLGKKSRGQSPLTLRVKNPFNVKFHLSPNRRHPWLEPLSQLPSLSRLIRASWQWNRGCVLTALPTCCRWTFLFEI